jgi:hypothetical protein
MGLALAPLTEQQRDAEEEQQQQQQQQPIALAPSTKVPLTATSSLQTKPDNSSVDAAAKKVSPLPPPPLSAPHHVSLGRSSHCKKQR